MNWQEITIYILVAGAIIFIGIRIYKSVSAKSCAKDCGCSEIKSSSKVIK